jgi:hypothetical protein
MENYKNYFEVAVSFQNDEGKTKTENYIFEANTHAEAEFAADLQFASKLKECKVKAVKNAKIDGVVTLSHPEANLFFKTKSIFTDINEKTGKEKKFSSYTIVKANNALQAYNTILEKHFEILSFSSIDSIVKTKIVDIIHS